MHKLGLVKSVVGFSKAYLVLLVTQLAQGFPIHESEFCEIGCEEFPSSLKLCVLNSFPQIIGADAGASRESLNGGLFGLISGSGVSRSEFYPYDGVLVQTRSFQSIRPIQFVRVSTKMVPE